MSGCQQFDCAVAGQVTGSEEDCCRGTQFTQSFDNCRFDDGQGGIVSLNGAFVLDSEDVDVCTGALPLASSFTAILSGLTRDVAFADGSFSRTFQELTESFEVATGGCAARQPERFGFGIHGDGRRVLDGQLQQFLIDAAGNVLVDSEADVHGLEITVGSTGEPDECTVTAGLNGSVANSDFRDGTTFLNELTDVQVVQLLLPGNSLFEVSGAVRSDCLGAVTLSTDAPLRVVPGDTCFTAGRVEARGDSGIVAANYARSGLDLDFGVDGSIDQHFATCTDVPIEKCSTSAVAVCGACTEASQCRPGLSCFPCALDCGSNVQRCSLSDTFVTCEDGVF